MVKASVSGRGGKHSSLGTTAKKAAKEAGYILAAPKGPRTVSHRRIKQAVDKVFRERSGADA